MWFHGKLLGVVLLTGVHFYDGFLFNAFAEDRNITLAKFFRFYNEVPTLLMIGIVIFVIVKPFWTVVAAPVFRNPGSHQNFFRRAVGLRRRVSRAPGVKFLHGSRMPFGDLRGWNRRIWPRPETRGILAGIKRT